jgi:hypothetical protein
MPGTSRALVVLTVVGAISAAVLACTSNPVATSQPVDPAGVWVFDIVVTDGMGSCDGEEGESSAHPITITKTGSAPPYNIVASGFLGNPSYVLTGTFDANNRLLLSGSYPEDGGTTSPNHNLVATGQNRMEGTETWNWTQGGSSCPNSTSSVVAIRQP